MCCNEVAISVPFFDRYRIPNHFTRELNLSYQDASIDLAAGMFTWRTSARQAENGNRDIEKIAACRTRNGSRCGCAVDAGIEARLEC
jgi:hypothetical protein